MKRLGLTLLVLAISALAVPISRAADPPPDPGAPVFTSGVACGDVTSTRAILWTRVDRRATIKLEVWDNPSLTGQKAFQKTVPGLRGVTAENDFTIKVDVTGLQPDTQYFYRFRSTEETNPILGPVGTCRTAPDPSQPANVKFTYTGDSDGTKVSGVPQHGTFNVLNAAKNENGAFFVYNGDTIYSDSHHRTTGPATTVAGYRDAYKENRTYSNLTALLASTSTYAIWDDHEVLNDYDGQTVNPARYAAGREAFLEYMPIRETGLPHDPSCAGDPLYRTFNWGSEVDIFVLDERSCRSADVAISPCGGDLAPTFPFRTVFPFNLFLSPTPPAGCVAAMNNPSRTMLGPVQKAQFKSDLSNSTAKWKIVVNEVPIQQLYVVPYDRWEGYGAERNEILDHISNNGIDDVVFTTTDTHATLLNQVFKDKISAPSTVADELVTGPIATDTFEQEVIAQVGFVGLFALNQAFNTLAIDCRHLNKNSYASVDIDATAGTAALASKDDTGTPVVGQVPAIPCTATLGP